MDICVYGASSDQLEQHYLQDAYTLGQRMARRGHGLVFGGGATGMMGAAARGVHDAGGRLLGIAPSFFNVNGILYPDCTDFIYTETMRERKQLMEERADAFVMTAGGIGTWEEFFEVLTLKQLGRLNKPIAVLNTDGYFDEMQQMLMHAAEQHFMKPQCLALYRLCDSADEALDYLEGYDAAAFDVRHLKNL